MGLDTQYHFEYGLTTSYGTQAPFYPHPSVGSGFGDRGVAQTITGPFLTPGVTFHYRLVAEIGPNTLYGPDRTFRTPSHGPLDRRTINVLDVPYSAKGDGSTNDAGAIQAALDAAAARGGGIVLLAAGHNFLSSSLVLPSNTTLDIEGTLLEDPNSADYNYTSSAVGGLPPFGNPDPLIMALHVHNVGLVGHGAIQYQGLPTMMLGFSHVTNFQVRNVRDTEGDNGIVNFWFQSDTHGIIQGIELGGCNEASQGAGCTGADELALVNSSYVRITGSYLHAGGLQLEITEDFQNPNHIGWLQDSGPLPITHVQVDHNLMLVPPNGSGPDFSIIPNGNDDMLLGDPPAAFPDQRQVAISDVSVFDNHFGMFGGPGDGRDSNSFDCYCEGGVSPAVQSPVERVRFKNNVFDARIANPQVMGIVATDSVFDFPNTPQWVQPFPGPTILNPDFADTPLNPCLLPAPSVGYGGLSGQIGCFVSNVTQAPEADAWWTAVGNAGATTDATPPKCPADGTGQTWAGYVTSRPTRGCGPTPDGQRRGDRSELYQGVSLPAGSWAFSLSAAVQGKAVLFARDTCTGTILASQTLTTSASAPQTLTFTVPAACEDVQLGVAVRESDGPTVDWAMITNAAINPTGQTAAQERRANTRHRAVLAKRHNPGRAPKSHRRTWHGYPTT
jgi:hypothetical protein